MILTRNFLVKIVTKFSPTRATYSVTSGHNMSAHAATHARSAGRLSRHLADWNSTNTSTVPWSRSSARSVSRPTPSSQTCVAIRGCTQTADSRSNARTADRLSPQWPPLVNISDSVRALSGTECILGFRQLKSWTPLDFRVWAVWRHLVSWILPCTWGCTVRHSRSTRP